MPPGVGSSVATVAVADAVEDHPRLRFEDSCTDLLSEPVSGDADGRFDRLEEVEVGVSWSQLERRTRSWASAAAMVPSAIIELASDWVTNFFLFLFSASPYRAHT